MQVEFNTQRIGSLDDGEERLEATINRIIQAEPQETICHELFEGVDGDLYVTIMRTAAATQTAKP